MTAQTHIVTGLPGNGKTLYTIHTVESLRKSSDRHHVYYHGIDIDPAKLPDWVPLDDPRDWHKCPTGSIVVLDEAQKTFVKRGNGAPVPEYVSALETLRHQGIELWLITQHPMLIDSHARKLIGDHRHLVRAFGAQAATVHRWNSVQEQCDKSRADSEAQVWAYPVEVFGWYKSAEIHTIKRRLPRAFWFLVSVPVVLAVCVWIMIKWYQSRLPSAPVEQAGKSGLINAPAARIPARQDASPKKTRVQYLEEHIARLPGLPHTAPAYDEVTRPVEAPYPAACVEMQGDCRCYTQQATRMAVPVDLCRSIVGGGFFVDWQTSLDRSRGDPEAARGAEPKASTERVRIERSAPFTATDKPALGVRG